MRQSNCYGQLHLHTAGIGLDFPVFRKAEPFQVGKKDVLLPARINPGHHTVYFKAIHGFRQIQIAKNHAETFLDSLLLFYIIFAQNPDRTAVPVQHIQNQLDRGRFSRAVFSDKTHDASPWQSHGNLTECKARIGLGEVFDYHCIIHFHI